MGWGLGVFIVLSDLVAIGAVVGVAAERAAGMGARVAAELTIGVGAWVGAAMVGLLVGNLVAKLVIKLTRLSPGSVIIPVSVMRGAGLGCILGLAGGAVLDPAVAKADVLGFALGTLIGALLGAIAQTWLHSEPRQEATSS
jgi:hypothetical protein